MRKTGGRGGGRGGGGLMAMHAIVADEWRRIPAKPGESDRTILFSSAHFALDEHHKNKRANSHHPYATMPK